MEIYLVLIALAGIVAVDTTAGPQFLISEPIVSCSLAGFLFGEPETGLMTGMFFQLLWFGYLPLGAVRIPDSNMGAFIAAASMFIAIDLFGMSGDTARAAVVPTLAWGAVVNGIGSRLQAVVRRRNNKLSEYITERLGKNEPVNILHVHLIGIGSSVLRGISMSVLLIPAGVILCWLLTLAPGSITHGIAGSVPILWGTAGASAVIASVIKGQTKPIVFGAIAGILWIIIAVSSAG